MKSMINTAIDQCYGCQVATKGDREEPIKVTSIPNRPWGTVSIDQTGTTIPSWLTREPDTQWWSLYYQPTSWPTRRDWSTWILRGIESDNRPPFSSKEFNEFAKQEGFQHHRVAALHPRMNGQVERFMQTLNRTEQISNLQGKNRLERKEKCLQINTAPSYRSCTLRSP